MVRVSVITTSVLLVGMVVNEGWTSEPTRVLASFTCDRGAGELLLPVHVQGQPHLFLMDTGAELTIFDAQFRPHLGKVVRSSHAKTPNGDIRIDLCLPPAAKVGQLEMQTELPVICTDLSRARQVIGHDIQGMLGMDFLRNYVVRIDPDAGEVQFLRSVPDDAGRRVALVYRGLQPRVPAVVAGVEAIFTVDTGCSQTANIDTALFNTLVANSAIRDISFTQAETLSGTKRWRNGRSEVVMLAEFKHRNLVLTEAIGNQLGLGYLSRFVLTLDFPNSQMYVKPSRSFDSPDHRDASGLHLYREGGRTVVHSVDAGSPAAEAGIRQGDVIVQVDGQVAARLELSKLRRLLMSEGQQIELVFQRGNGRLQRAAVELLRW